jgi:hypothetical protein
MRDDRNIIQRKIDINDLGRSLINVADAYKRLSVMPPIHANLKATLKEVGIERFLEMVKAKTRNPKPSARITKDMEERILAYTREFPTHGQDRVSIEMKRKGIPVSPGTVRGIWLKYRLERRDQRIKHQQQLGKISPPSPQATVTTEPREAPAATPQARFPAWLLVQDTHFAGHAMGLGKIYQQTGIDCYSGFAFTKLYKDRTALTAADFLNDRVLPFFDSYGLKVHGIVTDLGTEFCGISESHPYEVFLNINDIEHIRSKSPSSDTLGKIEKLNHFIQESFYNVIMRSRGYPSLNDLQNDLDTFIHRYNTKADIGMNPSETSPLAKFLEGVDALSRRGSDVRT